jgi:hypothetical protein
MSQNETQKLFASLDVVSSQLRDIKNLLEQLVKQSETQKDE